MDLELQKDTCEEGIEEVYRHDVCDSTSRCYQYALQGAAAGGNTRTVVSDSVIRLITRLNVAVPQSSRVIRIITLHFPLFAPFSPSLLMHFRAL